MSKGETGGARETGAPPSRVTMSDVARQAGVSQTTVSLVLNEVKNVRLSAETRARVREAANELGYFLSHHHRASDVVRPPVIAFLINEISAAYPIDLVDAAQRSAAEADHQLVVFLTRGSEEATMSAIATARLCRPKAFILASSFTASITVPEQLRNEPTLLLNCLSTHQHLPTVLPAEVAGGRAVAQHLLSLGRRRIGVITGDPWQIASRQRLQGHRQALKAAGLPTMPELVRQGDWGHRSGFAETVALLRSGSPIDAIACQNDIMARGCLSALHELRVRVPDDVAVVGYDNREFAALLDTPLSTVVLPHADMAQKAIAAIVSHAADLRAQRFVVPCTLIARESTLGRTSA